MAIPHHMLRAWTLALGFSMVGIAGAQQPPAATQPSPAAAQLSGNDQQAAITKKAQAFVEAFQKGDASAIAEFWAPDGDYTSVDGRTLKGRKEIAQDFTQFFSANKGATLRVDLQSLRFPTPDVAIEEGTSTVIPGDGGVPDRTRYSNVLVKKNGEWFLESVQESPYIPPSNYGHLQPLDWLVGEWVQQAKEGPAGRIDLEWTPDRNFIIGTRTVDVKGALLDSGLERIGWDPSAQMIRSWNFENNGGFSQGTWSADGEKWIITSDAVQTSGLVARAETILTRTDPNTITLQTKLHIAGSKDPKDLPVVTMKRAGEQPGESPADAQSALPAGAHP